MKYTSYYMNNRQLKICKLAIIIRVFETSNEQFNDCRSSFSHFYKFFVITNCVIFMNTQHLNIFNIFKPHLNSSTSWFWSAIDVNFVVANLLVFIEVKTRRTFHGHWWVGQTNEVSGAAAWVSNHCMVYIYIGLTVQSNGIIGAYIDQVGHKCNYNCS